MQKNSADEVAKLKKELLKLGKEKDTFEERIAKSS